MGIYPNKYNGGGCGEGHLFALREWLSNDLKSK